MGKVKFGKSADNVSLHKASIADTDGKKLNPFEMHVNKEKFSILGKPSKHDKGTPGISRSKAIQKRKDTIGQEYLIDNKINRFKDKRIGVHSTTMTKEEKNTARFIAERIQRTTKKSNKFNLNDDEQRDSTITKSPASSSSGYELTHKGQTLKEIEQFKDVVLSSDNDSDEELDDLAAKYTEKAHFGGGAVDAGDDTTNIKRSAVDRKLAINDLISETKRRKVEMFKVKEEVKMITDKLDKNWKSLLPIINKMDKGKDVVQKNKPDDYDRTLRELIFEPRGEVSDKLPTDAEAVKKEKEHFEKIEHDRIQRMKFEANTNAIDILNNNIVVKTTAKHRSADDLDDSYNIVPVNEDEPKTKDSVKSDSETEEDTDNDESTDESQSEVSGSVDDDSDDDNDDDDDDDDDDEIDIDDRNSTSIKTLDAVSKIISPMKENIISNDINQNSVNTNTNITKSKLQKKKDKKNKNNKNGDIFEFPETYLEFLYFFKDLSINEQDHKLKELIHYYDKSLDPSNASKLVTLFVYLLQYLNDTFGPDVDEQSIQEAFQMYHMVLPYLYQLSEVNTEKTGNCFREIIKEKQNEYKKSPTVYPGLDALIFLKAVIPLYSTSDFRHPVVTPCIVFISQILSNCLVRSVSDIGRGLFLVTILLDYTKLSKRFLPSAINFLRGCLYLSIRKHSVERIEVIPPFLNQLEGSSLLHLEKKYSDLKTTGCLSSKDLVSDSVTIPDDFKIRAMNVILHLIYDLFHIICASIHYLKCVTSPFVQLLDKLPVENYPESIRNKKTGLEKYFGELIQMNDKNPPYSIKMPSKNISATLHTFDPSRKPPKQLVLMQPKFDKVYDKKSRKSTFSSKKSLREGMIRKIKRETKGAIREIRRDNKFLAKLKMKQRKIGDTEREEKVRTIMNDASVQQAELNTLARKKKHM